MNLPPTDPQEITRWFVELLKWISVPGAPMIVMYLVAQVLEKWPTWATAPKWLKWTLPILSSVALSLLSNYLIALPGFVEQFGPIVASIMTAILAYLSSQKSHQDTKEAKG